MKIYDFKEFLDIEDVAEYLADKNICNFDPWEPLERARLDNILVDINITPIYKIDGTFDVEITRMQAKDTLEIENIGEITLDIIGYFKKNRNNSYSLVKYYNKKDFNLDILYHFLIECNIDKVSAYLLAASGKSVSINPMYFLDFKLHKTKYVTNNNELFEEPPIILEYYQKSQLEAIFNQSDPIEQLQTKQIAELQAKDDSINNQLGEIDERTETSYLVTIGLLLELLKKSKGFDKDDKPNKPLFGSNNQIIQDILDYDIYGQKKSTLEKRFAKAGEELSEAQKKK